MKTISIVNYKGGVGKTTLVANLASELAYRGKNILVLDFDPQASLTFSFIKVDEWQEKYEKEMTIKTWFYKFLDEDLDLNLDDLIISPKKINRQVSGKIDLICSHLGLIDIDLELAARLGGSTSRYFRKNYLRVYTHLKKGLMKLDNNKYDFILIDCPPNFNIVTRNAIVASDAYLVPAKPDYLSTLGITELEKHISTLIEDYNTYAKSDDSKWNKISPRLLGIVFTMVTFYGGIPVRALREFIAQVGRENIPIFENYIRENKTAFADALDFGVPVVIKTLSGNTYKNIQVELEKLTTEFLEKVS